MTISTTMKAAVSMSAPLPEPDDPTPIDPVQEPPIDPVSDPPIDPVPTDVRLSKAREAVLPSG
jgi:hypothetical protein